jgi:addiction module RelE/StbE family toxin
MYELKFLNLVKKDYKKLDKKIASLVKLEHLEEIKKDPYKAEKLKGDLSGFFAYHFKYNRVEYRISYTINESKNIVEIYMINKRENFYKDLKIRISN